MACVAEEHANEGACVVQDVYQPAGQFLDTKAALCIHNIAFQVHTRSNPLGLEQHVKNI